MKKFIKCISVPVCLLIVSAVLLSCGKKTATFDDLPELPPPVGAETTSPAVQEPAETEEGGVVVPDHLQSKETGLRAGIWYAYSKTGSSFYCFYSDDPTSGIKISVADAIITPFRYEKMEKYYLFHFGKEDDYSSVTVTYKDTDHADFEINGTYYEELEYISEGSYKELNFYTNEDIINCAKDHYKQTAANPRIVLVMNGVITERKGAEVTVQLTLQQLNKETEEVETVVCESYTVNRMTAKGVDSKGNEVDISQ